jgi:hypothetical protein
MRPVAGSIIFEFVYSFFPFSSLSARCISVSFYLSSAYKYPASDLVKGQATMAFLLSLFSLCMILDFRPTEPNCAILAPRDPCIFPVSPPSDLF